MPDLNEIIALPQDELRDIVARFMAGGGGGGRGGRGGAAPPTDPKYFTPRALLAVPFGVLISVIGVEWLVDRGRMGRIVAALLIFTVPLQFASFARDYFTDYQIRSAYRFDSMNFRGVAAYVIASDASARVPAVYLSEDLVEAKTIQWKFHLLARLRPEQKASSALP